MGKDLIDKPLLIVQDDLQVVLGRHRGEKPVGDQPGVFGELSGQTGLLGGVVHIVLRVERVPIPDLHRVVGSAAPELDLHDDVSCLGLLQEAAEATPMFGLPLVEVILVAHPGKRPHLPLLPAGHHGANVVGARRHHRVQMSRQHVGGQLEQVVIHRPAQQQDGCAVVLPVVGIL